jgi:hypothetical protein
VSVFLSAFICLALYLRSRLRVPSVLVLTPILITGGLLASPVLVATAAGPLPRLGRLAGINVDPSLLNQWIPAIVASAVGIGFSILVLKRANRCVLITISVVVGLYGLTWRPGVPLVRSQLRRAEAVELRQLGRELWPDATEADVARLDRDAEEVKVEVYKAIPIFPALVWVEYSFGGPPSTYLRRVVIWGGLRSWFLSHKHANQGLWEERLVPRSIHPALPIALASIAGTWIACDIAIWLYRRREHSA